MKVLITGCGGFVAPYVTAALRKAFAESIEIVGTTNSTITPTDLDALHVLDITDALGVKEIVAHHRPDHFIHLAGISHIISAADSGNQAWMTNVFGVLNCANALFESNPDATFVFASSGQVYGDCVEQGRAHTEKDLLAPTTEYGVTKAAADLALGAMAARGLRTIRLRLYNHIGPGQSETFSVSSFAAQISRIERGEHPAVLRVGNLESKRDFLDVRDVARAYVQTILKAKDLAPGTALNVCSGQPVTMQSVLEKLLGFARTPINVEIDPLRWRKADVAISYGDPTRCQLSLDWKPRYSLDQTLSDVLSFYR